jgi:endonuclease/exonuclease/phosphatase family metal-dependent hydrolase
MKQFNVATYNIDGLPEYLDLNDLPWILKPIAWLYRLIKKTTLIYLNDNDNAAKKMVNIGQMLHAINPDIIAVQEDFNFHNELASELKYYHCGKHTGGFDLSKIFSTTEWLSHFPLPRFKADGLNIFTKNQFHNEEIISWKKSYGYISHANDLLTHKGFRRYTTIIGGINIDVYIVHMDADFYRFDQNIEGDVNARRAQFSQLVNYIISRNVPYPVIVMGDTNCLRGQKWDDDTIQECFMNPIYATDTMVAEEVMPNDDVDRIFYINNTKSKYLLSLDKCGYLKQYEGLSDHLPFYAVFNIFDNKSYRP